MKKVLILAAHPDDETLGCGGIISKFSSAGVEFRIVFIGEGSSCRFDAIDSEESLCAIEQRTQSAQKAMQVLQVDNYQFHDLSCGRFDQEPIITINKIIEKTIDDFKPDTVFTHSPNDVNNDHRIVFNATLMATRPGAKTTVPHVLAYEVLTSSEWAFIDSFKPNYFIGLDKRDIEKKWQALKQYESEIREYPYPRSKDGLFTLAMQRGMQAGCEYAEAFQLVREIR